MDNFIEELIIRDLLRPIDGSLTSSSESNNNSSSDDEEHLIRIKRVRMENYVENVVPNYSNSDFKSHFRMNRTTVNKIIDLVRESGYLPTHIHGREKISADKAVLLTLWYFSNTETFRQVADRFNVTLSSVHRSLRRVLNCLLSIKSRIIKWPENNDLEQIIEGFRRKKGIYDVVGAIDGSHIEINKPADNQLAYINRKGYHSLLIQGIVDCNKKFLDVYCGEPGSMHDARLLRKSKIYETIYNNPGFIGERIIVGDTAYPNLPWLVTPYKDNGNLTNNQRNFNYRLSATRVVVEHAFGLLKGRFRRLRKLDNLDKHLCSEVIMCACVLHNICIDQNDFIETDLYDFNQPPELPNINLIGNHHEQYQLNRQQQLFDVLYNNEH